MNEKFERLTEMLRLGVTGIVLDARQPGVDVPDVHRGERLMLNLSYRYSPCDLKVNEWGVRCTLSFSGVNCPVAVPWAAIFAVRSNSGDVYFWQPPEAAPVITKRRGIMGLVS